MKAITAVIASLAMSGSAMSQTDPSAQRLLDLHRMPASEFGDLEAVGQPIDFDHIDSALLDAAVFHETNRRRAENNLPSLDFEPILREAARIQARGMRQLGKVTHVHPDEEKRQMPDRFDFLGIFTNAMAENVAESFGIRYKSGEKVYTRKADGKKVFSREPDGPPIQPHTYATFAVSLLDAWMASPGHKKNILAEQVSQLGTAALHDRSALGMDTFYCAQEFSGALTVEE